MELKIMDEFTEQKLDEALENGIKQINDKGYETILKEHDANPIMKYVAVFDGKRAWVKRYE